MQAQTKNVASLFVIRGHDQGRRFHLEHSHVGVGRDVSNVIQLHDSEVSRRHAELRSSEGAYLLTDLGSANGTYVNGQRVRRHGLISGDQVLLGSTLMLYTAPGEESEDDLASKIVIGADSTGDESQSRIVHSLRQTDGSEIFSDHRPTESPWLARARSNLQVMYQTALAVSHTLDIDQLLDRILQLIFEWVEADRGCVMLTDSDSGGLVPKARKSRQGFGDEEQITISKTILDYVTEHNEGVLTSDAKDDERWNPAASIVRLGIREAICVPMQGRYHQVGVIYIDTSTSPEQVVQQMPGTRRFTEDHLKLMIAIAHQAALAVEDTRYYSAMVQAERMAAIGHTIATLSHHIKNILQGIRASSYFIEQGLANDNKEMLRHGWGFVEKNQEKISSLVMDMLSYSKEREPELEPANLNDVIGDVVELQQARAAEREIAIIWQPADEMPISCFDPEGIHRAALNIVTNAIDACENQPRREVLVTTAYDAGESLLNCVIEDSGVGIPAEEVEHIFTVFHSSKGSQGTGLGLPVSQKILREHGGQIRVESEPGRGSRFVLEIPAVTPGSQDESPLEFGGPTQGGLPDPTIDPTDPEGEHDAEGAVDDVE